MAHLQEMKQVAELCREHPSCGRFLTVYIQEASGGTGLDSMKPVKRFHASIQDRAAAARKFIADTSYGGEVVLDYCSGAGAGADGDGDERLHDNVMHLYDAYPDRTFVLQRGAVVSDGGPPDRYGMRYDIEGVLRFVQGRVPTSPIAAPGHQEGGGSGSADQAEEEAAACGS